MTLGFSLLSVRNDVMIYLLYCFRIKVRW